jgi:hypothetical protein
MKHKLGAFYTCYDELEATRFSISSFRSSYPLSPIRLFYEGDADFKSLESEFSNLISSKEEDTLSKCFGVGPHNYLEPDNLAAISKCAWTVLERLASSIEFLQSEYVIMLDPDAIVRGQLNIPDGSALLGSRINSHVFVLSSLNRVLIKYGGVPLTAWGATPTIFNADKFLSARKILLDNPDIFPEMCAAFYAIFAHDILLPSVFSLIGESEVFNPDIIECGRDANWRTSPKPLLHQYRELYPKRDTKYAAGNW